MASRDKRVKRKSFSLAAMGDVMLDRKVGKHFKERPSDFKMTEIASVLSKYDLVFLNLENPVGTKGTPHPIQKPNVTFCSHPDTLEIVKNIGVTAVSLGNNHMLDYGDVSLIETLENLDAHGIKHVGAGRNYKEANEPLLLKCNGIGVAVLSYVFLYSASTRMATKSKPGVSDHRIRKILPRIRELKLQGYQVLVSLHWGIEYNLYPLPYQMKQARQMIDSGASLIIGHSPHYPQGIENYRNSQIVYSLGNFIFDEPEKYSNRTFIYGADITESGKVEQSRIYPVHIVNHVPSLVQGGEKQRMERLIRNLSEAYPRKSKGFWKSINALYFSDIIRRIKTMKSFKFLLLPPFSFYFGIGIKNFMRKISVKNVVSFVRGTP